MYVFAHLHKCAGTSIIEAAKRAGLNLPPGNLNGNPVDDNGVEIDWFSKMSREELGKYLWAHNQAGTDLLAWEWDFPLFINLPSFVDLTFFTIFRDPIDRIVSNMKMDAANGYGAPVFGVRSFLDGSQLFRSSNYYTRFFCGAYTGKDLSYEHVEYAFGGIMKWVRYCFIDDDIGQFTASIGLPFDEVPFCNRIEDAIPYQEYAGARFKLSTDEIQFLYRENCLDYTLLRLLSQNQSRQPRSHSARTAWPAANSTLDFCKELTHREPENVSSCVVTEAATV